MDARAKFDQIWAGFVPAILAPIATLYVSYYKLYENHSIIEFFSFLTRMGSLTKLLSLCVVPNLLVFFIFIWLDYLKAASGALGATFVIAFIIVIIQVAL